MVIYYIEYVCVCVCVRARARLCVTIYADREVMVITISQYVILVFGCFTKYLYLPLFLDK